MFKRNQQARITLLALDGTGSRAPGLTVSASISKDGSALVACTNAPSEIGLGLYSLVLTALEMDAEVVVVQGISAGYFFEPIEEHTEADYTSSRAVEIDTIAAGVVSIQASMARSLGLMFDNVNEDSQVWDGKKLTSARLRCYDTAAHALSGGATGLLYTYSMTAQYDGSSNCIGFQFVRA
jgi:hypothetical protein